MRIKDFFNNEFREFSNYDNVRSIPSLIDGFKDSQRKAIFGMIENGQSEIKVAQAAGSCALSTNYAHGENSMGETIVGLAQSFPGSNNINLLEPIGQFGSILSSTSASHRYIYTKLSDNLKSIIRKEDNCIIERRVDDGKECEPVFYYPLLPLWLINGAIGIGTGHSVKILQRDPNKIKKAITHIIDGKTPDKRLLLPTINNYKGNIVYDEENNRYEVYGKLEVINTTTIRITEIPFDYGLDKYKAYLIKLMDDGIIKDFDNNSTEQGFDFELKVPRETGRLKEDELYQKLKLISRHSENITLWDRDGVLTNYENVLEPLQQFVEVRLEKYEERRLKLIELKTEEVDYLLQRKLFILELNKLDNPGKMKIDDIKSHMFTKGIKEYNIDKLLRLSISNLSLDLITDLEKQIKDKEAEIKELRQTNKKEMYKKEMDQMR